MTTIATDGKTIAADGRATCNGIVSNDQTIKVFRLPDDRACGSAGSATKGWDIIQAMQRGDNVENMDFDEVYLLVIDGSDTVEVYEQSCKPIRLPVPYAVGSGREIALGALDAGKTPVEAVKIACKRDIYSGGKVRSIAIKPKT